MSKGQLPVEVTREMACEICGGKNKFRVILCGKPKNFRGRIFLLDANIGLMMDRREQPKGIISCRFYLIDDEWLL